MSNPLTLSLYKQLPIRVKFGYLWDKKKSSDLCAGVTNRFHEICTFPRIFLSVKTRGFSLYILAPFLAIDNIVCVVRIYFFYLSEQIDNFSCKRVQYSVRLFVHSCINMLMFETNDRNVLLLFIHGCNLSFPPRSSS